MMKRFCKEENLGITLIALVITIVVLIILATVVINLSLGNNGIVNRAKLEVMKYNNASNEEKVQLLIAEWRTENYNSEISFIDFLNQKLYDGFIDDIAQTDEGIEIYIGNSVTVVDSSGKIIKATETAKERPEITYTLSSSDSNQDKVTITVKATIKEGNIINIVKPNGDSENADEIEFDVTKNGKYEFKAISSTGTNRTLKITITNIKIKKPVIIVTQNPGYAMLTEYGVISGTSKFEIQYEDNEFMRNLYSEDEGITWKEYTEETETSSNRILAKSVIKDDENISSETTIQSIATASDGIGNNAYDESDSTYWAYSNTTGQFIGSTAENSTLNYNLLSGRLNIDDSAVGKKIRIKFTRSNDGWYGGIVFFDSSDKEISRIERWQGGSCDSIISVPTGAKYIKCFTTANGGSVYIYDIKIANEPTIKVTQYFPTLTENGILPGYNTSVIEYDNTSEQKLYKINDEEWKLYNGETVKVEFGDTLYAKGIDKYGKETRIIYSYTSTLRTDAMGINAYDDSNSTYWRYYQNGDPASSSSLNSTLNESLLKGRLNIDNSAIGKTVKIKFTTCNYAWNGGIVFYNSSNKELDRIAVGPGRFF